MGIRCADHVTPLYPQKLALTSLTGGGRSVGIVRLRTKATEFFFISTFTLTLYKFYLESCGIHLKYGICENKEKLWGRVGRRETVPTFKAAACLRVVEVGAITKSRSEMRGVCHDVACCPTRNGCTEN